MRTFTLFLLASCLMGHHGFAADSDIFPQGAQLEKLFTGGVLTEGAATALDGTIYFSDITFTYVSAEGTPLRANVELSLTQFEPDDNWGAQNPTSGTPKPRRTHQVQVVKGGALPSSATKPFIIT